MPSRTLLVAASAFAGDLSAERVAEAVARGLRDGGWPTELCPLRPPADTRARSTVTAALREQLDALGFDTRMRGARALVVCASELRERTLAASPAFELATRARQAGVPAYAVTAANRLDAFDARVLDLQAIAEGATARSLRSAGRELAGLI